MNKRIEKRTKSRIKETWACFWDVRMKERECKHKSVHWNSIEYLKPLGT